MQNNFCYDIINQDEKKNLEFYAQMYNVPNGEIKDEQDKKRV